MASHTSRGKNPLRRNLKHCGAAALLNPLRSAVKDIEDWIEEQEEAGLYVVREFHKELQLRLRRLHSAEIAALLDAFFLS